MSKNVTARNYIRENNIEEATKETIELIRNETNICNFTHCGENCKSCISSQIREAKIERPSDTIFKKNDLKDGMVVEFTTGNKRFVLNGELISDGYSNTVVTLRDIFSETLKNMKEDRGEWIYKIYTPKQSLSSIRQLFEDDNLELIWERDFSVHKLIHNAYYED